MTKEVEQVLSEYVGAGLGRLEAIRTALDEEKLERDVNGELKLRGAKRRPGRQLLAL